MDDNNNQKKRICLTDEIRGFAVLMMVLYHCYFVMGDFFGIEAGSRLYDFFAPAEPFFAGLFIIICGMSCTLSRSNLKRGFKALAAALAFTLVTAVILPRFGVDGAQVWFGILHFLACSILFYALAGKLLDRVPPRAGLIICAVLFIFFRNIEKGRLGFFGPFSFSLPEKLYTVRFLVPFGIYPADYYAADSFPLLPFIFVFLAGVCLGRFFKEQGYPEWAYKKRVPFLDFIGTHAFIIYLLHIPVTALLIYGIMSLIKLF